MTVPTPPPSVSLYGHWICPFVTRVGFALAERGIDHDLVDVPPSGVRPPDFVLPPEFVEHSPRRRIVRLDGLRRLGFEHPLPDAVDAHRRRCRDLDGWSAVAWSDEQTDELVGRFEARRRRTRARA